MRDDAEKRGQLIRHLEDALALADEIEDGQTADKAPVPQAPVAASTDGRKAPPRVRKPSPHNDQCLAPTGDLESHRARLREAFGNTLSDEFVEVLLGKLMEALRPNPFDNLQEPTLNAALALIDSIQPRSEMEALIAVQIVATGLSGRASCAKASTTWTRASLTSMAATPSSYSNCKLTCCKHSIGIGAVTTRPSRS